MKANQCKVRLCFMHIPAKKTMYTEATYFLENKLRVVDRMSLQTTETEFLIEKKPIRFKVVKTLWKADGTCQVQIILAEPSNITSDWLLEKFKEKNWEKRSEQQLAITL